MSQHTVSSRRTFDWPRLDVTKPVRLSRRDRAQVAELLRCAADVCVTGDPNTAAPFFAAAGSFALHTRQVAWEMRKRFVGTDEVVPNDRYQTLLLEAAQRVEEGSWP